MKIYTVKPFGNSGHIIVAKKLVGRKVKVAPAKNILTEQQQDEYKVRLANYEADYTALKKGKFFNKQILLKQKEAKIQEIKRLLSEFEEEE